MNLKSTKKHIFLLILRYVIMIGIVGGIVLGILLFLDTREKVTYEAPRPAVVLQQPIRTTIEQSVELSGYVEADAMIPVVPLVSGTIMEYPVKAGEYVDEGDLLAVIDKRPYEQQMLQAEAAYLAYQSTFERVEGLYQANAVTRQNYDEAKAQRDASLAQYDLAKLQLSYADVTAPVSGTVLMAPSAKGSIGVSEQPVAVIADLDNQVVRLNVPEKYFSLFNQNRAVLKAIVTRPGTSVSPAVSTPATIETIAPYVQPESKVFEVVCRLQGNLDDFRPGMYVKVTVVYETWENVAAIAQATRKVDGSCYIYDEDTDTVRWVNIQPLVEDDSWVGISDEYAQDWFVVDGQHNVFDGQHVTVQERRDSPSADTTQSAAAQEVATPAAVVPAIPASPSGTTSNVSGNTKE